MRNGASTERNLVIEAEAELYCNTSMYETHGHTNGEAIDLESFEEQFVASGSVPPLIGII